MHTRIADTLNALENDLSLQCGREFFSQFRDEILQAKMESDEKNLYLTRLNILENRMYPLPKPKAGRLWSADLSSQSYEKSITLSTTAQECQTQLQHGHQVASNVLMDLFRPGEYEISQDQKILTDVFMGATQVVFDVSQIDNHSADNLKENEEIKQQWNTYVQALTTDKDHRALINTATNQNILTHLPISLLKELLPQQLLPLGMNSVEDPTVKITITIPSPHDTVIYHLEYNKHDDDHNLIYTLTGDVILKKNTALKSEDIDLDSINESQSQLYSIKVAHLHLEAYSPQVKYIFPGLYNRAYLETQLASLRGGELTKKQLAWECAFRYASEKIADKLSSIQFQKFVEHFKHFFPRDYSAIELMELALISAQTHLCNEVRNIINTIFVPDETLNNEFLTYYLNDLSQQEQPDLKKCAEQKLVSLSISQLNNFLRQYKRFGSRFTDDDYSNQLNKLYISLTKSEQENLHKEINQFINDLTLESEISNENEKLTEDYALRVITNVMLQSISDELKLEESKIEKIRFPLLEILMGNQYLFRINNQYREKLRSIINQLNNKAEINHDVVSEVTLKVAIKSILENDLKTCQKKNIFKNQFKIYGKVLSKLDEEAINDLTAQIFQGIKSDNKINNGLDELSIQKYALQCIENNKKMDVYYLNGVIRDFLKEQKVAPNAIVVSSYTDIILENLVSLLPTSQLINHQPLLLAFTKIIHQCEDINDIAGIIKQARAYIICDVIANDFKQYESKQSLSKIQMTEIPKLYEQVVLPGMQRDILQKKKNSAGRRMPLEHVQETVINNFAQEIEKEFKSFTYQDVRSLATDFFLQKKSVSYLRPYYQKLVEEKRKNLKENETQGLVTKESKLQFQTRHHGISFYPTSAQADFLANMTALVEMHYQRVEQLDLENETSVQASHAFDYNKLNAYFKDVSMPKDELQKSDYIFLRYLLDIELWARDILDREYDDKDKDVKNSPLYKEEKFLAQEQMALINQYRYFNFQPIKNLQAMLNNRHVIFTDFDQSWYAQVEHQLRLLKSSYDIENQLVQLENLYWEGVRFARNKWQPLKSFLHDKLSILNTFIEDFTNECVKYETRLIKYKINIKAQQLPNDVNSKRNCLKEIKNNQQKILNNMAHAFSKKQKITYVQCNYSAMVKEKQNKLKDKIFKLSDNKFFEPNAAQKLFLAHMAALTELYEKRCQHLNSAEFIDTASEGILKYQDAGSYFLRLEQLEPNANLSNEDLFKKYLFALEYKAYQVLRVKNDDGNPYLQQQKFIAQKQISFINQYHYRDTGPMLELRKMLDDKHLILTDFKSSWFNRIEKTLDLLIKNPTDYIKHLSTLESLYKEGMVFTKKSWQPLRSYLEKKLTVLDTFIKNFHLVYTQHQTELQNNVSSPVFNDPVVDPQSLVEGSQPLQNNPVIKNSEKPRITLNIFNQTSSHEYNVKDLKSQAYRFGQSVVYARKEAVRKEEHQIRFK